MPSTAITFAANDVTVYLAAAGAGKTTAIMNKMTELLDFYRPDEIAFVTFTRKGVANGIERALRANPQLTADDLIYFKTLHALCFRELGLKHASIITRKDMNAFNKTFSGYFNVTLGEAFEEQSEDDKLLSRYDALRSGSRKEEYIHGSYNAERYNRLIRAYESFKKENGLVDFYDCLLRFKEAGKPVAVKVAFIDEAQDLTLLQWEVCQTAFSLCEKVYICGDDYQSLFTYSGASPNILVSLARRYTSIKLEKSYRLPKAVYRFAKGITCMIGDKIDKDFKPVKDVEGFVKEIAERQVLVHEIKNDMEKNGFEPHRWYLLFRNNCFIQDAADLLEQFTIPYHTHKGFCLDRRDIAKIRRYYRYQIDGYGTKDALDRFCGEYRIKDIKNDFIDSDLIPGERRYVFAAYTKKYGIDALEEMALREPFLLLSTTYRVKGGEADYVAVFLDCTRRVNENALINIDEELRVLYVACTRARIGLYLIDNKDFYGLGKIIDAVKEQIA